MWVALDGDAAFDSKLSPSLTARQGELWNSVSRGGVYLERIRGKETARRTGQSQESTRHPERVGCVSGLPVWTCVAFIVDSRPAGGRSAQVGGRTPMREPSPFLLRGNGILGALGIVIKAPHRLLVRSRAWTPFGPPCFLPCKWHGVETEKPPRALARSERPFVRTG